jgi:hypothetical protein
MHPTHRQIVRRTVMTLAGVVILGSLYVNVYWLACWADWRGVPYWGGPCWNGALVFHPLTEYGRSDLPGARDFEAVTVWILNGINGPLSAEYEFCARMREEKSKSAK